jgi:hypothetical protein
MKDKIGRLVILFCMVLHFLSGQFKAIVDIGIGFRRIQKGQSGSVVVEVILVSRLSTLEELAKIVLNSNSAKFFGTDVAIFLTPAWSLCSNIQNEGECIQFESHQDQNKNPCGWCSLVMTCMQGMSNKMAMRF